MLSEETVICFDYLPSIVVVIQDIQEILCFFERASRNFHLKKNQIDAQFIFSIFHQTPLHLLGISIAQHQEVHRTDTTIGTYCSF
jgi:hypothetical protein